ncbi:twinkle mtDNA helicase-like [Physella acuta]|uniref:twinkle mtDNA helicase-like n=1 Tax=Physella acuta TaxID=109671 RepID=UPI0027DDF08E|nr:twinkle mtDNA helicase-like [Physella acuta]
MEVMHSKFRNISKYCSSMTWCKQRWRSFTKEAENSNNVSSSLVQQVLLDLKMKVEQGHTSLITQCPKISKTSPASKTDNLFINNISGHFVCEHCNKQGLWADLQDNLLQLKTQKRKSTFDCFKDLETVKPYVAEATQAKDSWQNTQLFGSLDQNLAAKLLETFNLENLSVSTLDKYNVRCDPKNEYVLLPYMVNNTLTGFKKLSLHSHTDEEQTSVRESYTPRTGPVSLFGLDIVPAAATEVILTSTEFDAMAVYQETKKPAISLPRGYSSLPQEALPSLERFKTVVLWFGDDVRAWEMAKLFSKKLNSKRCHIIRPSVEEPGPATALTQGLKLSNVLNKARPISHDSIVNFAQLRQEVWSQMIHSEQVAGVKWKRYPLLNKLLKGHRRGELTVFTGPTGSGKTTFISDYSLDLCIQGVNTLWGSFEINNARLAKTMLTQFALKNLSKNLELFDHYADQFQTLPMYFMTFHGQESVKKVIDAMSHAVYVHDIGHVILDNLQFMMGVSGSEWTDRFLKQDLMISALRKFATNMNCHVTLVIHPRKEKETEDLTTASVFGSAKATQEADNVLILQDKRLTSVRGKKYLQITKNRFDGELGIMLLKFDKDSLSFAMKEKEKTKKADGEEEGEETQEQKVEGTQEQKVEDEL